MSMFDQAAIVAAYTTDTTATVGTIARQFDIKDPTVVSTILKLNGVKLRQGNNGAGGNLTPEARAKGIEVRRSKALVNQVRKLVDAHGLDVVNDTLAAISLEDPANTD